jgi:hypothetical protein
MEALALVCFFFAATACIDAFQTSKKYLRLGVRHTSTSLAISLSNPPINTAESANDDDNTHSEHQKIRVTSVKKKEKKKEFDPFYKYLKTMSFRIKSKRTQANRMDDELKRLEINFYNLTAEDAPQCRQDVYKFSYKGPLVRPDASCYSLVCNTYANAGLGETGAVLAEEAFRRYEEHDGVKYNAFILTALMKAWAAADDWEKADFWLQEMEDKFAETKDPVNAPNSKTYTSYIKGLANSRKLNKYEAAEKSLEILNKMREFYCSGENTLALPNRFTYSSVMKCQEHAYAGIKGIFRVEKVFRQLQDDYNRFGVSSMKPSAISALPLFTAASHCTGGIQAAERVEKILEELQARYDETGDLEYRPLEAMYTSLLATFAKVDSRNAKMCSQRVDKVLEAMKRNNITPSTHAITSGKQ